MTYEFLPQEEPGKPLVTLSPGFTERVMQRIEARERTQKRRRMSAMALTILLLLGGIFALSARRTDQGRSPDAPRVQQAGPVTPRVKPAPSPQPAPPRIAVKGAPSGVSPARHDHGDSHVDGPPDGIDRAVAAAGAAAHPGEVALTIDGTAYRCPADIFQRTAQSANQVEEASNVPPAEILARQLRRCRLVTAPRQ